MRINGSPASCSDVHWAQAAPSCSLTREVTPLIFCLAAVKTWLDGSPAAGVAREGGPPVIEPGQVHGLRAAHGVQAADGPDDPVAGLAGPR